MTDKPKVQTMADIFEEEEAAEVAKHQAWLADPVAQAAYQADVAKRQAALDAAYREQLDQHDDDERRADLREDDPEEEEDEEELEEEDEE